MTSERRSYDSSLNELIQQLRTNDALLTELTKRHSESIAQIHTVLFGKDGNNGVIGRLNRLSQAEDRRTWHIRLLWAALISSVSTSITAWWVGR